MLRTVGQKLLIGVVMAALLIMPVQLVMGEEQGRPKPGDFFWEAVAAGTLGAFLGLTIAAWAEYGCPAGVSDFTFYTIYCGQQAYDFWIQSPRVRTIAGSTLVGGPMGASSAIYLISSLRNVDGNLHWLIRSAFLSSVIGRLLSFWTVPGMEGKLNFFSVIWPLVTGLGAAIGYSLGPTTQDTGAQEATASPMQVSVPLFELRF